MDVVFIPGLLCTPELFKHQADNLPQGAHPHLLPLPDGNCVESLASQLLQKCPSRFVAVGVSLGGIVAMEMMRQAAERIEGVALLGTCAEDESESISQIRYDLLEIARHEGIDYLFREKLAKALIRPDHLTPDLLTLLVRMGQQTGLNRFAGHADALASRTSAFEVLSNWKKPSLLVCGKDDKLCPPRMHYDMLASLTGAEFHQMADCGHLSVIEKPEQTSAILCRWLSQNFTLDNQVEDHEICA